MYVTNRGLVQLAAVVALVGGTAFNASWAQNADESWRFTFTPYVWFSSVDYEVETDRLDVDGDSDFDEIFQVLDYAIMTHAEAWKGRYGLILNLDVMSLSEDMSLMAVEADAELDMVLAEVAGAYRVVDGHTNVDLIAGGRYVDMDFELDVSGLLGNTLSASPDKDWAEPLVGARISHHWTERWYSSLSANVGGFSVGSDFTWEIAAFTGFHLTDWVDLQIGYRHLDIDYDDNGLSFETQLTGPMAGFTFNF